MKKTILAALLFTTGLSNSSFAESKKSLTPAMAASMRMMASTYEKNVATELQLRAVELYSMGQALMSHEEDSESQAQGKKITENAKKLYEVSRVILGGIELSPDEMEKFVNKWTLN